MQGLLDDYSELALWLQSLIALAGLAVVALAVNWLIKRVLLRAAAPYLDKRSDTVDRSVAWLATVIPLLIVSRGVAVVRCRHTSEKQRISFTVSFTAERVQVA